MLSLVSLVALPVAAHACVVEAGGYSFDFSTLAAKQFSTESESYTYLFTFCQAGGQPCGTGGAQSSLCQTLPEGPWEYTLGLWDQFKNWQGSPGKLTGTLIGEYCIGLDRETNITFQCGDGPVGWVSMVETSVCKYEGVIQVPSIVCGSASSCCSPPTFAAIRMEAGGTTAVVQRDGITGDWYDGDYQQRGQQLLCSSYYNRCFTFTSASCTGSAYRPVARECYGEPSYTSLAQLPLMQGTDILQTAWMSKSDGNYVVTMPLGSVSTCVAVSGSAVETSVGFSLGPDPDLWEVPQICLKDVEVRK